MAMVVRTNAMAMNANRQLGVNNSNLSKSLEKLSSGYKINRAGDDAAGLAISEKMKAQIKGLDQASSNAQDGISLVQTAEGATTEIHNMLNRMVELATKSANGTIDNDVDRKAIQTEVDSLKSEITRITDSTNFNGITLLNGTLGTGTTGGTAKSATVTGMADGAIDFSVSGNEGLTVTFATDSGSSKSIGAGWSGSTLTITLKSGTATDKFTQEDVDNAIAAASGAPAAASNLKVTLNKDIQTTGTATGSNTSAATVTTAAAKQATATATNTAGKSVTYTANAAGANTHKVTFAAATATNGAGTAAVGNDGNTTVYVDTTKEYSDSEINSMLKNAGSDISVSYDGTTKFAANETSGALAGGTGLATGGGLTLQIGDTADSFNKVTVQIDDLSAKGLGISDLKVDTQDAAGKSIQTIKDAINMVSTNRANLGALQNRMEYSINNLNTTSENMSTANSRIRDTDMASEMTKYTQSNILTQAAQAMLAQANQAPQQILQLLQ